MVVIRDQVYDVPKFVIDHPGGKRSIMLYGGQDATEQFEHMHQESVLRKFGPPMVIGKLAGKMLSNNKTNKSSEKKIRKQSLSCFDSDF